MYVATVEMSDAAIHVIVQTPMSPNCELIIVHNKLTDLDEFNVSRTW